MYGTTNTTVEVFCSYAHEDEVWLRKLETHLSPLKHQGLISLWHDRLISPSTNWAQAIDGRLEAASIILLLVSADFFASNYCYGIEMKRALERQEAGEAQVISIVVRSVDWKDAPFAHLQVLPTDAKPISTWSDVDTAFADVVAGIRRAIGDLSLLAASAPRAALPSIWMIPYAQNPFFLGREELLAQLHERLRAGERMALSQPQAISGLGGIGKTQLAVEYAYRYAQDYQNVLWARAEDTEALVSSFTRISRLLGLPERDAQEQAVIIEAVRLWLQTHGGWLLILDNADELAVVSDYLPSPLRGHLLITTRAAATGTLARRLEVETLAPEQGAVLLLRRAGLLTTDTSLDHFEPSERELAVQISNALGGLPLALDQAGACLEETGMGLVRYWQLYQQHRRDLLLKRGGVKTVHPEPVATTWALSFQKVQEKQPAAADLLRLCAFLAPDAIPEKLVVQDAFELSQAVEGLRAYSLVRYEPRSQTLWMHRLVQAVVCDDLPAEEKKLWMQRAVTITNATFPGSDQVSRELWLPHALVCKMWIEQEQMVSPEAANLLRQTGYYLCEHARYTEAEPLYKHCLDIRERSLGGDHPDIAQSLSDLANLYSELGRYKDAVPLCRRSLHIWERSLGCDHPDVARPLNNLAILCKVQGKYKEAERLYRRSLHIWERSLGGDHPDIAQSRNNLAVLYAELGRYAEAEKLFTRSLAIRERVLAIRKQSLGPAHLDVAQSLSNLANLYTEQGKYAEAESLYQRSLHIFELNRRSEHSDAAYPLNGLGILYKVQGTYAEAEERDRKYEEAEKLFTHSLYIWEQILGPEHPQVAYSLHNLAVLYTEQGKYAEAEEQNRKYEEAEKLFTRSLYIWKEMLRPKHLHTRTCAKNYAGLLHILKRDADALELERQYFFSDVLLGELLVLPTFRSLRL